jgi:uncharacterized protein (DUF433 family)
VNATGNPKEFWRSRLDVPNYLIRDAARYAHISPATVTRWHQDTTLPARAEGKQLSYLQLIELAVVAACRQSGMKLVAIRRAREYLAKQFGEDNPFAMLKLKTDGVDLLMDHGSEFLVANMNGQLAWKQCLSEKLQEFEYEGGLAARWHLAGSRSPVIIDPRIQFGVPAVNGVPTWIMSGRYAAGEDIASIAEDFGLPASSVTEALLFEGLTPKDGSTWSH